MFYFRFLVDQLRNINNLLLFFVKLSLTGIELLWSWLSGVNHCCCLLVHNHCVVIIKKLLSLRSRGLSQLRLFNNVWRHFKLFFFLVELWWWIFLFVDIVESLNSWLLVALIICVWILVLFIVFIHVGRYVVVTAYFIVRLRYLMCLSQLHELISKLLFESIDELFVGNLLETQAEVSLEEDALNKVIFKRHRTVLLPEGFQGIR